MDDGWLSKHFSLNPKEINGRKWDFEIDHKYFRWGQEEFEIFTNAVFIKPLSISITWLRINISGQTIESFYSLYISKIKFNFFCL